MVDNEETATTKERHKITSYNLRNYNFLFRKKNRSEKKMQGEKRRGRGREEKELKEIRTEKDGEKEKGVNEEVAMQEWEEYFMKLLESRTEKGETETEMKKKQTAPEETEITVEQADRQIRKVKKRKLTNEIKETGVVPDSHTGFRNGRKEKGQGEEGEREERVCQ
jgi:hypothetical protein